MSDACPVCGLRLDTIQPGDAVTAIRSFPRRWRGAFASVLEDEAADAGNLVRRRPEPSERSAIEYAAHVAEQFELHRQRAQRTLVDDRPQLGAISDDERPYREAGLDVVLDSLAEHATALAQTLDTVEGGDWLRKADVAGTSPPASVLSMAREAVHEGYHHLRDVDRVLRAARASD